jgi:hypothetical protein
MKRALALALLIASALASPAFSQVVHCNAPRDAEERELCGDVAPRRDMAPQQQQRPSAPIATPRAPTPADKAASEYKSNWRKFEADNGAGFALDMNSIAHMYYCNGCTDVVICILDNDQCAVPNMRRWRFDCHGHYMDIDGGGMQIAPSRSVAGAMAAIACVGAHENLPPEQVQNTPVVPQALAGCTQESAAAEVVRGGSKVNDPCIVHVRSIEVRKHPERATQLECMGMMAYENPQPPGHPVSLEVCDRILRADQQSAGLPAVGLTEEMKANYRYTWGQRDD